MSPEKRETRPPTVRRETGPTSPSRVPGATDDGTTPPTTIAVDVTFTFEFVAGEHPHDVDTFAAQVIDAAVGQNVPPEWFEFGEDGYRIGRIRLDAVRDHADDPDGCTGLTASWCPVHGHCLCHNVGGHAEADLDDPRCPLHAPHSDHATAGGHTAT